MVRDSGEVFRISNPHRDYSSSVTCRIHIRTRRAVSLYCLNVRNHFESLRVSAVQCINSSGASEKLAAMSLLDASKC